MSTKVTSIKIPKNITLWGKGGEEKKGPNKKPQILTSSFIRLVTYLVRGRKNMQCSGK